MKRMAFAFTLAAVALMGASPPPIERSIALDKEARQNGITAVDPKICGGRIAVYIYDQWGFNFDATHPMLKICANSSNNIVLPSMPTGWNNKVSSARVRNASAWTQIRFYGGVNYQVTLLTLLGNRDEPRFSNYGALTDNNTSSIKRIDVH